MRLPRTGNRPTDPDSNGPRPGHGVELELERLDLYRVRIPLLEVFRSGIGERRVRDAVVVRLTDDAGNWGVGELACRPDPYFSGEFVDAALLVLERFLAPLLGAEDHPALESACRRVRDWPFTRSALLEASLDLLRRREIDEPLDTGRKAGSTVLARVGVGISLGLFDDLSSARERIAVCREQGYRRFKLKIRPDCDLDLYRRLLASHPAATWCFDANGSFGDDDLDAAVSWSELGPKSFEQPFAPRRLDLLSQFRERASETRICLDETITDPGELRALHELGLIDELNLKPGRVGGPESSLRLMALAGELELPIWVGGMFETGIGRAANLRYAARLPVAPASAVHDLSPSSRYFANDLLTRPIEMDVDGTVAVPEGPVEVDWGRVDELAVEHRVLLRESAWRPVG